MAYAPDGMRRRVLKSRMQALYSVTLNSFVPAKVACPTPSNARYPADDARYPGADASDGGEGGSEGGSEEGGGEGEEEGEGGGVQGRVALHLLCASTELGSIGSTELGHTAVLREGVGVQRRAHGVLSPDSTPPPQFT
eukprot:2019290-Rhodomonas_salina.1